MCLCGPFRPGRFCCSSSWRAGLVEKRTIDEERGREKGDPPRSLYFKQPRTCCNHLETMAHRSVRLAKRPGSDNSRDASSTTLRAIHPLRPPPPLYPFHLLLLDSSSSPSQAVSPLIFLPRGEFLPFACLATRSTTLIWRLGIFYHNLSFFFLS